MAMTLLKTATKAAIGVGAVAVTVDQGVWSTSTDGSKALWKVRTKVLPTANEYVEKIPASDDVNDAVVHSWNKGVKLAFGGVAKTPEKVGEYTHLAAENVKSNFK